jgi:hypothetical protein
VPCYKKNLGAGSRYHIPDTNGQGPISNVGIGSVSRESCSTKIVGYAADVLLQVVAAF